MTNKLFVGNIDWNTTNEQLNAFFSQVGNVLSAKIIIDRETNRPKGFGFVEMETPEMAQEAIAKLNEQELNGRPIFVNEAKAPEARPERR